ncbi:CRISPR-associated protein, Cse2 family [Allomeiothermus silvanus DSM 9946]|uniref:CRISPR-associated protein, Cse2 family n=1 Tax=Allomeiothermus silvanus (strain ATCC 700542 / DSM 9946 / NBRC 106475 / NCIMB 13440 / VI-R2) TaxID=526227 RepID=D7BDX7_ALLS1|nr:type I-E CRISPR-associated protein Cse2/CasB [Allomeiothermus silvanus]ADH63128.1 CRISPR-associated protein, Cse2 family [Allomeiothermus silvanus DSM 9946]
MQKEISREQAFVRHLRQRSEPADLARMRRALGDPGQEVIPVVEGFLGRIQDEREDHRERMVYYLVAGLWATTVSSSELEQFRKKPEEEPEVSQSEESDVSKGYRRTLGHAIAQLYLARDQSKSIEQRFIALLDADEEQLPYRIRQMVRLLKSEEGIPIYWSELLRDLLAWDYERRPVQQKWARAFYRTVAKETERGEEE